MWNVPWYVHVLSEFIKFIYFYNSHAPRHVAYGNLYGVFNTRRYTLVHGFCFFKLFLMVGKELIAGLLAVAALHVAVARSFAALISS